MPELRQLRDSGSGLPFPACVTSARQATSVEPGGPAPEGVPGAVLQALLPRGAGASAECHPLSRPHSAARPRSPPRGSAQLPPEPHTSGGAERDSGGPISSLKNTTGASWDPQAVPLLSPPPAHCPPHTRGTPTLERFPVPTAMSPVPAPRAWPLPRAPPSAQRPGSHSLVPHVRPAVPGAGGPVMSQVRQLTHDAGGLCAPHREAGVAGRGAALGRPQPSDPPWSLGLGLSCGDCSSSLLQEVRALPPEAVTVARPAGEGAPQPRPPPFPLLWGGGAELPR